MTLVTNADDAAVLDAITLPAVFTARNARVFLLPNRRARRPIASGNFRVGGRRRSFRSGDHAANLVQFNEIKVRSIAEHVYIPEINSICVLVEGSDKATVGSQTSRIIAGAPNSQVQLAAARCR